ncbi:MAG TPA: TAXI family TRAP transporter solute-binding subunit [Steroidobacteraceae bacterium]|nr:TAXI family TRAP transporter solute-binding subunit [Steroidobacteraceae bacterium]
MPGAKPILLGRPTPWLYALAAAALLLLAVVGIVAWLGPPPPRVVLMSTGAPGSDYALLAERYRTLLQRSRVELRLVPSAGAVENLQRLNDKRSGVAVAFAEGGLTSESQSPDLVSLGTMFFEPFWFFSRIPLGPHLEALRGKKLAIGQEGSGTRAMALRLLALNGLDQNILGLLPLSTAEAEAALLRGDIDGLALVASWDSKIVRQLLASSEINLVGFPRADAYVALYPYLSKLRLPAGVGNLAANRPPTDVDVIAPRASLIVRRDLHPAIQYLLLDAATQIHSSPGIFDQFGRFPAAQRDDLPLSRDALQFYKSGMPFLQRYLPFWLAVLTSRLLIILIPVAGVLYPLLRFAPTLYFWAVRRRVFRLYRELGVIETEVERARGTETADMLARLQRLDDRAQQLHVPLGAASILYTLRAHIALVSARIARGADRT